MEPLDDKELNRLLQTWEAPPAPPGLARRVLPAPQPWWRRLLMGSIRVPVPVALAAVALIVFGIYFARPTASPVPATDGTVSLADFQPVKQLEPIVIGVKK